MSNNEKALAPAPSSIDPLRPAEIARRIEAANVQRAGLPTGTLVLLGLIGGLYIGFGGALATLALTDNGLGFGLCRLTAGLAFSLGLVMLVLAGGELFTGNNLMAMAYVSGKVPVRALLRNWTLAYAANAAGGVLLAFAIYGSGVLETGGVGVTAIQIAEMKAQLGVGAAFLRGVLCNALVCVAIWLSTAARSLEGKVVAIVFPISAFVALGFEHCIANFYLIPVAMLAGANVSLLDLAGNIIPVTAGNTAGGVGVALAYWFICRRVDYPHRPLLSPSDETPAGLLGAQFVRAAGILLLAVTLLGGGALPAHGEAQQAACGGDTISKADGLTGTASEMEKSSVAAEPASLAQLERCPEAPVNVMATSPDERHLTCAAASDALELLGRCGISLRRPLRVQIMSEVRHPFSGAIFGLFDTKQERVLVTQEANIPSLIKDTPYADLPQRDFYRSLIVHEVVHGVMHQNLKRAAASHAAYEYPAYALQVDSLPPQVRDAFLQSFDQAAITNKSLFNDPVLLFDPYFFAARAYHHFKASTNGCAHLTALLEGEVTFIAPPQM